jgi:hypothetical protein
MALSAVPRKILFRVGLILQVPYPAPPHGGEELAQTVLFIERVKCLFVVYARVPGLGQAWQ